MYIKKTLLLLCLCSFALAGNGQTSAIVANPMNLNYRFSTDGKGFREAADPVCEYFAKKGKYYLFASKSSGYWSSPDLAEWTYIPCTTITQLDDYAPTILILDDTMYWTASGSRIYRNDDPDVDNWVLAGTQSNHGTDPSFFRDDDGRVYLYWGCSDTDPIVGVEVDPTDGFRRIGSQKTLITHNEDRYGWERQGDNNTGGAGWNEGPCINKYKGKYYLQYASPGTQFRTYADGVYVGDNPLGPYTYMENSPYCIKAGGFIGGAGHGHTFQDKYGNYWHIATMKISQREMFERRLGLFPVYFDEDDQLYARTEWTDYPFSIPDGKVDFQTDDRSMNWQLLSYKKPATASSSNGDAYSAERANDETVETWWSAASGNVDEWWQVDLGEPMQVEAIQVNFADQDFTIKAPHALFAYQYIIEASDDGEGGWTTVADQTANTRDAVHDLIVLPAPVTARYLRITNTKALSGKFSLYDFRVFGTGTGVAPDEVTGLKITRKSDRRRFQMQWNEQANADGYVVRWGIAPDKLNYSTVVYNKRIVASALGDNITAKSHCPSTTNMTTSGDPIKINGDVIEYMNDAGSGAFFEYGNIEGGAGGLSEICLTYSKGASPATMTCLSVSVNDEAPVDMDFPGTNNYGDYEEFCFTHALNAGATNSIRFATCKARDGINGACLTVKYPAGDCDVYEYEAGYFNADVTYYFAVDAFNENGITRGTTITEGELFGTPNGTPHAIPGVIEAEDFNLGGQGLAYYDTSCGNAFGEYRDTDVDIDVFNTNEYLVTNTATGEYLHYTVEVAEAGLYDVDCIGAAADATGGFSLSFNGGGKSALIPLPEGNALSMDTATLTNISLSEGVQVMTFYPVNNIYVDKFIVRKSANTGIQSPAMPGVSVYPNPSQGIFNIQMPQDGFLSVYNATGVQVCAEKAVPLSYQLDMTKQPAGVYLLVLRTNDDVYRIQLIKE